MLSPWLINKIKEKKFEEVQIPLYIEDYYEIEPPKEKILKEKEETRVIIIDLF